MDSRTLRLALAELKELKARETEYRAEVEEWYRSGDGRSPKWRRDPETGRSHNYGGKGYAFPYCPHGTSQWTDYDNICGGCEDGYNIYELAVFYAKEKMAEYNRRFEWFLSAPPALRQNDKLWGDIRDWMISALD